MEELEERLALVLELANIGYWDFDPSFETMHCTATAKKFLGLSKDRELSFPMFLNSVIPEDRENTHQAILNTLHKQSPYYEIEFRSLGIEDKILRNISAKGIVKFDRKGRPTRVIGVCTDLTHQRQKEHELEKAKEAAELANEAKTQFLANMSHEIRTPLGAVIGFTEYALDPQVSDNERLSYLHTIQRNGDLLLRLINDLLDISKVEANKVDIELIQFPFCNLLEEIVPALASKAHSKGLQFSFKSNGEIPVLIETDPTRLKQILNNVIGNAIKFTEKGFVEATARVVPPLKVGEQMTFEIRVRDTGIGISKTQREKLFQRFVQADSTMTRKYGGTGLGLALSQQLAWALGGDLVISESAPGFGSTFSMTLKAGVYSENMPMTSFDLEDQIQPIEAPRLPMKSLDGIKVLLVDDARDNQLLVSLYLKAAGAKVDIAKNGIEAIQLANANSYDVVLMDIQMPELDGYGATERLRHQGYLRPIIALTAHAMNDEKERCLSAGFDDHMTKPIDRRLLIDEVAEFAHLQHQT